MNDHTSALKVVGLLFQIKMQEASLHNFEKKSCFLLWVMQRAVLLLEFVNWYSAHVKMHNLYLKMQFYLESGIKIY